MRKYDIKDEKIKRHKDENIKWYKNEKIKLKTKNKMI